MSISKLFKMNSRKVKKIVPILALLFAAALMSSCNRGMGCPSNFKVVKTCIPALPGK